MRANKQKSDYCNNNQYTVISGTKLCENVCQRLSNVNLFGLGDLVSSGYNWLA